MTIELRLSDVDPPAPEPKRTIYRDIVNLPDPVKLGITIRYFNHDDVTLYFQITGSGPGYTFSTVNLGSLGSGANAYQNLDEFASRAKPAAELEENITLTLKAYTDSGYTNLKWTYDRIVTVKFINSADPSYTVDVLNNFDDGCYDEETEVLTRDGWKLFKDVTKEDEFATLNPATHEMTYSKPSDIVCYDHHKKLLRIKNRTTDLAVTLTHNMLVIPYHKYRDGKRNYDFIKAKDLPYTSIAPRTAIWNGEEKEWFILPEVQGEKVSFRKIPMDDWLSFLGLYIAEGSLYENTIHIAQKCDEKNSKIENILHRLPFDFSKAENGWRCTDKQLAEYLRRLSNGALGKYIPKEFKQLSPRQLRILYEALCLGDGTDRGGHYYYYSSSRRLADDVQELLLKTGKVGFISERKPRKSRIENRIIKSNSLSYEVRERGKKAPVAYFNRKDFEIINYEGKVYCVTVPYHTLYVRRNGKPVWCGNTVQGWAAVQEVGDPGGVPTLAVATDYVLSAPYSLKMTVERNASVGELRARMYKSFTTPNKTKVYAVMDIRWAKYSTNTSQKNIRTQRDSAVLVFIGRPYDTVAADYFPANKWMRIVIPLPANTAVEVRIVPDVYINYTAGIVPYQASYTWLDDFKILSK